MEHQTASYAPLKLDNHADVLQRIRKFENELSSELDQSISVVAYTPLDEQENLGHS